MRPPLLNHKRSIQFNMFSDRHSEGGNEEMHFIVDKDFETGERAGAAGTFQITNLWMEDTDEIGRHKQASGSRNALPFGRGAQRIHFGQN